MEEKFNVRLEIEKLLLKVLQAAEQRNERIKKHLLKENMLDEWLTYATPKEKEQALLLFLDKGEQAKNELRKQLDKHLEILTPEERKEALNHWMKSVINGGTK